MKSLSNSFEFSFLSGVSYWNSLRHQCCYFHVKVGDDECRIVDVPKTPPQVIDVSEDENDEINGGIKKLKVSVPTETLHVVLQCILLGRNLSCTFKYNYREQIVTDEEN